MLMLKQFTLLSLVMASCLCVSVRVKRQEDGEFWWLNKETAAIVAEVKKPEVKIQPVEEVHASKNKYFTSTFTVFF